MIQPANILTCTEDKRRPKKQNRHLPEVQSIQVTLVHAFQRSSGVILRERNNVGPLDLVFYPRSHFLWFLFTSGIVCLTLKG